MLRNQVIVLITIIVICSFNIHSVGSQNSGDIKAKPNTDQKQDNGLASEVKDSRTDSTEQGDLNNKHHHGDNKLQEGDKPPINDINLHHQQQSGESQVKEGGQLPINDIRSDDKGANSDTKIKFNKDESITQDINNNNNKNDIPIETKLDNIQSLKNSKVDIVKNSEKLHSEQKFESEQIAKPHETPQTLHSKSPDLPVEEKSNSHSQPTSQEKSQAPYSTTNRMNTNSEHEHISSEPVQSEQLKSDLPQQEQNLQPNQNDQLGKQEQKHDSLNLQQAETQPQQPETQPKQAEKQPQAETQQQQAETQPQQTETQSQQAETQPQAEKQPQQAETQPQQAETQIQLEQNPEGPNARDEHKTPQEAGTQSDAQKEQVKDADTKMDSTESKGNEQVNTKYTSYKADQHTNTANTNSDTSVDINEEDDELEQSEEDEEFKQSEEEFEADLKTMKEYWEQKMTEEERKDYEWEQKMTEEIKNYVKETKEKDGYVEKLIQKISDEKRLLKDNEEYIKKLKSVIADEKQFAENNEDYLKKFKHIISEKEQYIENLKQKFSVNDDENVDDGIKGDNQNAKEDESFEKKQVFKMHGKIYERVDFDEKVDTEKNEETKFSSEQDISYDGGSGGGGDVTNTDAPDPITPVEYMTTDDFPEPFKREGLDIERVAGIYTYADDNVKETMIVYKPDEFGYAKLEKYIQTLTGTSITTDYEEYFEHLPERVTHKHVLDQYEGDLLTSGGEVYVVGHKIHTY